MIRTRMENGVYLLGITEDNVRLLKEGNPMVMDMHEIGGDFVAVMVYGKTAEELFDTLNEMAHFGLSEEQRAEMIKTMETVGSTPSVIKHAPKGAR